MTARKRSTAKRSSSTRPTAKRPAIAAPAPALHPPTLDAPAVVRSGTGAELVDGAPYFATHDGVRMNRRQYLAATADERKARLVADLRAAEVDADGAD